jgi:hypothetical protein
MLAFGRPGFNGGEWAASQAGGVTDHGFQIHLELPFCSDGRISVLRDSRLDGP